VGERKRGRKREGEREEELDDFDRGLGPRCGAKRCPGLANLNKTLASTAKL